MTKIQDTPFCSVCGTKTPNGAPLCDRCLDHKRDYIDAAESYTSATLLSWKGLRDNLANARHNVAQYEQWAKEKALKQRQEASRQRVRQAMLDNPAKATDLLGLAI